MPHDPDSREQVTTFDTSRLVVLTSGALMLRNSSSGALVPLTEEELGVLEERFGTAVQLAINASKALR